jgi:hypothetical protein
LFAGRVLIQLGKSADDNHVESSYAERTLGVWGRNWYDAVMSLPAYYSVHDKLQAIRSFSEHTTCLRLEHLMHLRVQGELTFERLRADQVRLRVAISAPWWSAVVISLLPPVDAASSSASSSSTTAAGTATQTTIAMRAPRGLGRCNEPLPLAQSRRGLA